MDFNQFNEKLDHVKKLVTLVGDMPNPSAAIGHLGLAVDSLTDLVKDLQVRTATIERRFLQFDAGFGAVPKQ